MALKKLRVTGNNMTVLIEAVATLDEFRDFAETWIEVKESNADREDVRDAREDLDGELDGAVEAIESLYALLKG